MLGKIITLKIVFIFCICGIHCSLLSWHMIPHKPLMKINEKEKKERKKDSVKLDIFTVLVESGQVFDGSFILAVVLSNE